MLFPPEKRLHAYKEARDLYGLRSVIAHGSPLDEGRLKIAGEKVPLAEARNRATQALRMLIKHFLPMRGTPYKDADFWQRMYFGLPGSEPQHS